MLIVAWVVVVEGGTVVEGVRVKTREGTATGGEQTLGR